MIEHRSGAPTTSGLPLESVVALVDSASGAERELIGRWIADGGLAAELGVRAPVTQLDLDAGAIADRLTGRADDPLVVPVRVLWLPPERDGVRRVTFGDLALLTNPRRPNRLAQRRLVERSPDRHLILTGSPARLPGLLPATPGLPPPACPRCPLRSASHTQLFVSAKGPPCEPRHRTHVTYEIGRASCRERV